MDLQRTNFVYSTDNFPVHEPIWNHLNWLKSLDGSKFLKRYISRMGWGSKHKSSRRNKEGGKFNATIRPDYGVEEVPLDNQEGNGKDVEQRQLPDPDISETTSRSQENSQRTPHEHNGRHHTNRPSRAQENNAVGDENPRLPPEKAHFELLDTLRDKFPKKRTTINKETRTTLYPSQADKEYKNQKSTKSQDPVAGKLHKKLPLEPTRSPAQETRIANETASTRRAPSVRDPSSSQGKPSSRRDRIHDTNGWERYLSQSADDATIETDILTLFELIEDHVENYYRDWDVKHSGMHKSKLSRFQSRHLPTSLADLLEQSHYQTPLIIHCLTYLIVSGISFDELSVCPLLPGGFTAMLREIRVARVESRNRPHYNEALLKFRSLCVYLRPDIFEDGQYTSVRDQNIGEIATQFTEAFSPWEDPDQDGSSRLSNLIALLKRAAEFGIMLFSQPSTFVFNWKLKESAKAASEIPEWPRVLKVADESGTELHTNQVVVRMKTRVIGVAIEYPEGEHHPPVEEDEDPKYHMRINGHDWNETLESESQQTSPTMNFNYDFRDMESGQRNDHARPEPGEFQIPRKPAPTAKGTHI